MTRSVKKLALWLSIGLVILAGVSLVWPVNNTFLSGDCIGARLDDGSCPLRWDRVDTGSIREAVVTTAFLLITTSLPLWLPWRWLGYAIALVPLIYLSVLGVLVFGPVYVPALLALLLSAFTPSARRQQSSA